MSPISQALSNVLPFLQSSGDPLQLSPQDRMTLIRSGATGFRNPTGDMVQFQPGQQLYNGQQVQQGPQNAIYPGAAVVGGPSQGQIYSPPQAAAVDPWSQTGGAIGLSPADIAAFQAQGLSPDQVARRFSSPASQAVAAPAASYLSAAGGKPGLKPWSA